MTSTHGATIIITGGGSGIGAALARRFAADEPAQILLADVAVDNARAVASDLPCEASAYELDVSDRDAVRGFVADVAATAHIDLYCSNAGIASGDGVGASPSVWQRTWEVNVMGSVYASEALIEHCNAAERTRLLITASAAGLLVNLGDAPYTATKHAAVGLAEWLAIHHHDDGLDVSCLCPQGVRTPMVTDGLDSDHMAAEVVAAMGLIEPDACADAVAAGLAAGDMLILPHPEVADYVRHKANDHGRWIGGMRKLRRQLLG